MATPANSGLRKSNRRRHRAMTAHRTGHRGGSHPVPGTIRSMRAPRAIRRTVERFFEDPASVRNAAWLVAGATVIAVVVGGAVERVFDRRDFPNIGRAMWFTLQTVTTVGYGDVVP